MPATALELETVAEIKRLKAENPGAAQVAIAYAVGVSQGSVSAVLAGHIYKEVPWPNGSVGGWQDVRQEYQPVKKGAILPHTGRAYRVTPEVAAKVKDLLFHGSTQNRAAHETGISQGSVYQIRAGMRYPEVPWPNGATGPMSVHRIKELEALMAENRPGRRMKNNSHDELIASAKVRAARDPQFAEAIRIGTEALENADKPDPNRESVISRYRRTRQGPPRDDGNDG